MTRAMMKEKSQMLRDIRVESLNLNERIISYIQNYQMQNVNMKNNSRFGTFLIENQWI